jgi:hypothetical protein
MKSNKIISAKRTKKISYIMQKEIQFIMTHGGNNKFIKK